MTLFGWYAKYLGFVLFIELVIASSTVASTAEVNPLRPIDTSSPRATLEGFSGTMAEIYRDMKDLLQEYNASQRLYLTPDQRRRQIEALSAAAKAITVLDLTNIPPILRDTVAPERALQLKEVLDRIDLPSNDSIPAQDAMARVSTKRWRLPGTEIDIALVENGPRSGEYLVTADTVDRLPEFYDRVRKLPYKPGPALKLNEVFR